MNCSDDLDKLLLKIKSENVGKVLLDEAEIMRPKAITVPGDVRYQKDNIPTENAFRYVCGYLLKKCFNIHDCHICTGSSNED